MGLAEKIWGMKSLVSFSSAHSVQAAVAGDEPTSRLGCFGQGDGTLIEDILSNVRPRQSCASGAAGSSSEGGIATVKAKSETVDVAIMQPYLFPYIGYFQLIHAADIFVSADDVQWIKRGWINRNRILENGKDAMITLPVEKGGSRRKINERCFCENFVDEKERMLRKIENAYRRAPQFAAVMPVIAKVLSQDQERVSEFLFSSLQICCAYLGIDTKLLQASGIEKDESLRLDGRVMEVCSRVGGTRYINPIGGVELYRRDVFAEKGLDLNFLQTKPITYAQGGAAEFVPSLSIIDVMMFNSRERIAELLDSYDLI